MAIAFVVVAFCCCGCLWSLSWPMVFFRRTVLHLLKSVEAQNVAHRSEFNEGIKLFRVVCRKDVAGMDKVEWPRHKVEQDSRVAHMWREHFCNHSFPLGDLAKRVQEQRKICVIRLVSSRRSGGTSQRQPTCVVAFPPIFRSSPGGSPSNPNALYM